MCLFLYLYEEGVFLSSFLRSERVQKKILQIGRQISYLILRLSRFVIICKYKENTVHNKGFISYYILFSQYCKFITV